MAWVSLNTPCADFPSSRRNPSASRVFMPSVTWFSAKNPAGSMRPSTRSVRSSTVSRRAGSNTLARGVHGLLDGLHGGMAFGAFGVRSSGPGSRFGLRGSFTSWVGRGARGLYAVLPSHHGRLRCRCSGSTLGIPVISGCFPGISRHCRASGTAILRQWIRGGDRGGDRLVHGLARRHPEAFAEHRPRLGRARAVHAEEDRNGMRPPGVG